jgi:hypothetical protein
MNYRELLSRYKNGLTNEEEKQLIEEELEKYEALEEYLSECFDEKFDAIAKVSDTDEQVEETAKLKKSVNDKLRKVILTSVLIVVGLYIGIFYIGSGIIDLIYYDPTAVTQSEKKQFQFPDFYYDMQAYISLNMPGYSISSFTFQEPKGFGKYEVSYSLRDLFSDNTQRYFINLSRGNLTYAEDGIFSSENRFWLWRGYEKTKNTYPTDTAETAIEHRDKEIQRKSEETLRYLKELNSLSYLSLNIAFQKDLTMKEFYDMVEKYPSLDFKWVGVRTVEPGTQWNENQPMHLIGFNPNFNDEPSTTNHPDPQKYPLFNLVDFFDTLKTSNKDYSELISEAYGIHFRSRLEYLRNREEFVDIFDYNSYKTDFYEDSLSYIDEHGVKTYGVLVYGTAKDLSESIKDIPYDSLYINKVLPAKPNLYDR